MPLLDRLSEAILAEAPDRRHRFAYILPSRRACLVLKNKLRERTESGFMAPLILSIEDFVRRQTGQRPISRIEALGLLYEAWKAEVGPEADPLAFMRWGPVFLDDLDELEQAGAHRSSALRHLEDYKVLEQWGIAEDEQQSEHVRRYLDFWKKLPVVAERFLALSAERGLALGGTATRRAAENALDSTQRWMERERLYQLVFAGLNALSPMEERWIRALVDAGWAQFRIDAHPYLLEPEQEAGVFLRRYASWGVRPEPQADALSERPARWTSWGVSGSGAQLKLAAQLLLDWVEREGPEVLSRCALVLADESLLPAALSALPEALGPFNITMGLKLTDQPLFAAFERLVEVVERSRISPNLRRAELEELESLFRPYFEMPASAPSEPLGQENSGRSRAENGSLFIGPDQWDSVVSAPARVLSDILHSDQPLQKAADWALGLAEGETDRFTAQAAELCALCLRALDETQATFGTKLNTALWFRLLAAEQKLNFVGEPLVGLQIMGVLESRALGFEKLIVVSVNEGRLPKAQHPVSLLPPDLRKALSLHGIFENDALYAHHFFQLLSESGEAHLLWNAQGHALGGGEPSRFLRQIESEWTRTYPRTLHFEKRRTEAKLPADLGQMPEVQKTPEVLEALRAWSERGMSPSALSLYVKDPVAFYYRYLVHLEEDRPPGLVDAALFGTLVHRQLQLHFESYIGRTCTVQDVTGMLKNVETVYRQALEEKSLDPDRAQGVNWLGLSMTRKHVEEWLKVEAEALQEEGPVQIEALETKLKAVPVAEGVLLTGVIDRIEYSAEYPKVPKMLDYKTGGVLAGDLNIKELDQLFRPRHDKAFQLMCYALMIAQTRDLEHVQACISSTVKPRAKRVPLVVNDSKLIPRAVLDDFGCKLAELQAQMMNPHTPFKADLDFRDPSDDFS
ncbi:hypothetical protein GC167_03680 [bacterium]|nr:hypothetical protein [bacterium]